MLSKSKHPPNPLPCGCRAKAWPELYVVHCSLHAAALELLETLEAFAEWPVEHPVSYIEFEQLRTRALAAIRKAKGEPEPAGGAS